MLKRLILRRASLAAAAMTAASLAAGCDESLSTLAGPTPNLTPTFTSIQRDIFEATDSAGRAACTQCHNDAGARFTAGLNLRRDVAYNNLVDVPSTERPGLKRVQPGDPAGSYLIHKVRGGPNIVGERMPRTTGPFLTEGQIAIIERWIALGAPRD